MTIPRDTEEKEKPQEEQMEELRQGHFHLMEALQAVKKENKRLKKKIEELEKE